MYNPTSSQVQEATNMKLQVRTRKRIFTELCQAQQAALASVGKGGHTYSDAVEAVRSMISKHNSIGLLTVKQIEEEGIVEDWPEEGVLV